MTDSPRGRAVDRRLARRGVSSVLSMMFLVIFGSLGAAMAVVAQGNLRTADSALRVSRAASAAETGLIFGTRILQAEVSRCPITPGVIDAALADRLWRGTYEPPESTGLSNADGGTACIPNIAAGIVEAHEAYVGEVVPEQVNDELLPSFDAVRGEIHAPPIRLGEGAAEGEGEAGPTFRLSYHPVPGTSRILVVSEGRDGTVRRTVQMEFELDKRIEYAVLSPNRLMIGKNVVVEGPLGTTYGAGPGELETNHGHPLVLRSNFNDLDPDLDESLRTLAEAIAAHDVDGDNRLRTQHPLETAGLALDETLADHDGDEYVDDLDLFLGRFDLDGDGRVVWDPVRTAAAGLGTLEAEFAGIDDQLARLLDRSRPDRNGDGRLDDEDVRLGWDDGVVDGLDRPAKVHGTLRFAVGEADWETAAETSWQTLVQGGIRSGERAATSFDRDDLRVATTDTFAESAAWFSERATTTLDQQVAEGLSAGGLHVPAEEGPWEEIPFGSASAYDWYRRPVYENMTFRNVRIPAGTNALFRNCVFEGVTYIETESDCGHVYWNIAGAMERVEGADGEEDAYRLRFPGYVAASPPDSADPIEDTKTRSNNLRFDACTFLGSIAGDTPAEYTHWRNKVQFTGPTRLFNDPDDPDLLRQTDGPLLRAALSSLPEEDLAELRKSSMMLPGWSVDVGNFSNEQAEDPDDTARIRLSGTVVAGVLDIRGTADLHGTLLTTYRPVAGEGPMRLGGTPDAFNTTIGYFGSLDGDFEGSTPGEDTFEGFGEIVLRWDPGADLPDGILWPIQAIPVPETYREARHDPQWETDQP